MDLLFGLNYTELEDFYINIKSIRAGWMEFRIGVNKENFCYQASYLGDPLNDLLKVANAIVNHQQFTGKGWYFKIGDFYYVTHELEPSLVTWLFKSTNDKMTLIIWKDMPGDIDTFELLVKGNFDTESAEIKIYLDSVPDVHGEIAFSMKGTTLSFIKALLSACQDVDGLDKSKKNFNKQKWGFSYQADVVALLEEWVISNETSNKIQ